MMETLEGGELCFPQLLNTSCRKPKPPSSEAMVVHILLSSISVLTVVLNLLVIISISHYRWPKMSSVQYFMKLMDSKDKAHKYCLNNVAKYRHLHTPTNLLLLSLAVSDLFVGLVVMPVQILLAGCWFLGDLMCSLYWFVDFIIISASVGNMVLISVDRYVAICDPLCYPTKVTQRRVQICVCLCWICSFFYSSLMLKDNLRQPGRYKSCHGECVVVFNDNAGAADFFFTLFGPITVIIVLYVRVFVVAVSQARAMRSHIVTVTLQRSGTVTAKKSEMKAARTLGIVVVVFLICFCPYYWISLAGHTTLNSASSLAIGNWLLYFNSCLNPVIYAFFYPWFRKSMKFIVTLQILQSDSCEAKIL